MLSRNINASKITRYAILRWAFLDKDRAFTLGVKDGGRLIKKGVQSNKYGKLYNYMYNIGTHCNYTYSLLTCHIKGFVLHDISSTCV